MPEGGPRYMRLLVFFDLPVKRKEERKEATRFRKFLIDDGYVMLQFSVYMRICRGQDMVDTHLRRLEGHLPSKGSVRALQVTDQQYARMKFLVGKKSVHDKPMEQCLLLEF